MTQDTLMTIHEQWVKFRQGNIPIECGVAELKERKLMFYAGFLCGFTSLADAMESTDIGYVRRIERELQAYMASL